MDAIVIGCDTPGLFLGSVLGLGAEEDVPRQSVLRGVVKRDHSAEFQLLSGSGELLGDPILVSAGVVKRNILNKLVCTVEDRFLVREFDEH